MQIADMVSGGSVRHRLLRYLVQPQMFPLYYSIVITMAIMSYFADGHTLLFVPLNIAVNWLLFRFFDFVNHHHFMGGLLYVLLAVLDVYIFAQIMMLGDAMYPVTADVWCMTPQSLLDYYPLYAVGMFSFACFFVASCTYYFTIVRYRVSVSFLLMLFPLLLYAKEAADVPDGYLLGLFVLYFAVMVCGKQLVTQNIARPQQESGRNLHAAGAVLTVSILVAMAIPKPTVSTNRDYIEDALNFSALTDYLMASISDFVETSNGGGSLGGGSTQVHYYVNAPQVQIVNLKSRTFTEYDLSADSWHTTEYDSREQILKWRDMLMKLDNARYLSAVLDEADDFEMLPGMLRADNPYRFLEAVQRVVQADSDFAARYDLADFAEISLPREWTMQYLLRPNHVSYQMLLLPTRVCSYYIESSVSEVSGRTDSGTLFVNDGESEAYGITYYSQQVLETTATQLLCAHISQAEWSSFLQELLQAESVRENDELWETVASYYFENERANAYTTEYDAEISQQITALAQELTDGLTSDYDKASAIAAYFDNGEFTYDNTYEGRLQENAEDFLFESKTGVCYEFATAMTLLCRAAGLPARYVEGYSMNHVVSNGNALMTLRDQDAHAFVEVYLSGYGWASFDPTIADNSENRFGANGSLLQFIGITLLAVLLFVTLLYLFLFQRLSELLFRRRYFRIAPEQAAVLLVKRIRHGCTLPDSMTLEELAVAVAQRYPVACELPFTLCSASTYGGMHPTDAQRQAAYAQYLEIQEAIKQEKKQNRKNRRKRRSMET